MASRAGRLLGGLLGRLGLSGAPGRHRPWGGSRPRGEQHWPGTPSGPGGAWGPDRPPRQRPSADEVRRATRSADQVDVRVVGTVPPDGAVVDGEIEGEPDRRPRPVPLPAGAVDDDIADAADATDDAAAQQDADVAVSRDGRPADAAAALVSGAPVAPAGRPPRRLRDDLLPAAAIAVAVLLVLVGIVYQGPIGDWFTGQRVQQAAKGFARAWQAGTLRSVQFAPGSDGAPRTTAADALSALVADRSRAVTAGLTTSGRAVPTSVSLVGGPVTGRKAADGSRTATQRLHVVWTLDGGRRWAYDTTLALREEGTRWRVLWAPQTVHPRLTANGGLVAERVQPPRARIVGARTAALSTTLVAHRVVYSSRALIRPRGDMRTVAQLAGLDPTTFTRTVTSRPRGTTVPVAVLRDSRWRQVSAQLLKIRGVSATTLRVAAPPTPTYARSLLGEAMPASPALARASGGDVVAGELVGTSGLQRTFDARLRGTPGLRVVVLPLPRSGTLAPRAVPVGDPPGTVVQQLATAKAGVPLRLTLDARVQGAAQAAVDAVRGRTASLVAVDVRTGRVVAVASNRTEEWDRPLLGAYPPGSTFKIVTTWALTKQGVTPSDPLTCPATIVVRGNPFRNGSHAPGGVQPLARQFAASCNTAFAGLGDRVPDADVQAAARDLGLTVPYPSLGTSAFTGLVPATPDAAVHAASLIGQGHVEVSPLAMAVASATVADGRFRSPQLVLDGRAGAQVVGPPLDPRRLATLRSLMCEAVRSGTATGLRSAPGGPVSGKTGTAQFGSPDPVGAHAWFTGYQDGLAFAVVVENGGWGASTAVPVARTFLRGVRGGAAHPAATCGAATAALG